MNFGRGFIIFVLNKRELWAFSELSNSDELCRKADAALRYLCILKYIAFQLLNCGPSDYL